MCNILSLCSQQILFLAFKQKPIQKPIEFIRTMESDWFPGFGLQKYLIPAALYCPGLVTTTLAL